MYTIVLTIIAAILMLLLLSRLYFLPKLVKSLADERLGFLYPEENRIYYVLKGKAFHKAILLSQKHFLDIDWIVRPIKTVVFYKNPHFTAFRRYFVLKFNAWWFGLPWIYKIDKFKLDFIQLETTQSGDTVIEEAKKVEVPTDHLRLFYQYLVITPDVRTGGVGQSNNQSELINLITYSLYRIKIVDAYKARFEFSNHVEYFRTEVNGAIRDMMGDLTIENLNEANLNDFTDVNNPFKKMVDAVNGKIRERLGIEIVDAIFLRFEPADDMAKKTLEAGQGVYIAEQEAIARQKQAQGDQDYYRIKLGHHDLSQPYAGNAEAEFFEKFKDMPMYGRIQVIKALPKDLLSVGGGLLNFIMGGSGGKQK